MDSDVWRIEGQARKTWLRLVGIKTFQDLEERQGDLLRYLVNEYTTLHTRTEDSNRSRCPCIPYGKTSRSRSPKCHAWAWWVVSQFE